VEGGEEEIPAASVNLDTFDAIDFVTLAMVMGHAEIPYYYPAAERIYLIRGLDYMLEIRNYSDAVIYCGGQTVLNGQQAMLSYGQKLCVVFEDNVNEYDIYYQNAARVRISSDHIHIVLDDQPLKQIVVD